MNALRMALRVSTSGEGRRSTPAIKVAVAAVALSVAVMLAAIAVVLGFKQEITRKVTGFNPHIILKTNQALSDGEYLVSLSPSLREILDGTPYIKSYSLAASAPAIFKTESDFKGVYLRSLGKAVGEEGSEFLNSQLTEGSLPRAGADTLGIVISQAAADQLLVNAGDTLPTYFITDRVDVKPLVIKGVYNSHFSSYDDIYAFGSLPMIQQTGNLKDSEGTSINIYVDDFSQLEDYARDLRHKLDLAFATGIIYRYYDIETALSTGANFFSWLALLDTNVVVILALMTAVALITLISGMMIIILDKQRFIYTMRALGASNGLIRRIFVWLTVRVAFTGLIIGNAVMLVLLFCQEKWHFLPLDPDSYYIDFIPVKLTAAGVIGLNAGVIVVTYVMLSIIGTFGGTKRVRNTL